MKKIIFLVLLIWQGLPASEHPVDISFLVADLKYNEKQGVKICEIQQARMSRLSGYDHIYHRKGLIGENLCQVLSQYHDNFWFITKAIHYSPSKTQFKKNGWKKANRMKKLLNNKAFFKKAARSVSDPYSICEYHAILYVGEEYLEDIDQFREKFPGVILIDAASWPYCYDKYKMSKLFLGDELLENVKPRWGLYPKTYSSKLAKQINEEIKSDMLVIKPRAAARGQGVIIVRKENLDQALKYIFTTAKKKLKFNEDNAYRYWTRDSFDSFLVEEYVESDPVYIPEYDNLPFNGTMRIAFVLVYDQKEIHLDFLGGYWITPDKAITERGNLHEKHKASTGHICIVDPEVREEIKRQLTEPLKLMYSRMLVGD